MATVRIAVKNDIPRVLELYRQLTMTASEVELLNSVTLDEYQRVFNQIGSFPGYSLLVAEERGEILGTMVLLIVPNLTHGALPWAAVENVVVDSRYRRRGIGKLLMDYVVARAKEAGCYKVQLISDRRRQEAHKFYEALGYGASGHGFRLYL